MESIDFQDGELACQTEEAPWTEPDRTSTIHKEPYDFGYLEEQAMLSGVSEYTLNMSMGYEPMLSGDEEEFTREFDAEWEEEERAREVLYGEDAHDEIRPGPEARGPHYHDRTCSPDCAIVWSA